MSRDSPGYFTLNKSQRDHTDYFFSNNYNRHNMPRNPVVNTAVGAMDRFAVRLPANADRTDEGPEDEVPKDNDNDRVVTERGGGTTNTQGVQ